MAGGREHLDIGLGVRVPSQECFDEPHLRSVARSRLQHRIAVSTALGPHGVIYDGLEIAVDGLGGQQRLELGCEDIRAERVGAVPEQVNRPSVGRPGEKSKRQAKHTLNHKTCAAMGWGWGSGGGWGAYACLVSSQCSFACRPSNAVTHEPCPLHAQQVCAIVLWLTPESGVTRGGGREDRGGDTRKRKAKTPRTESKTQLTSCTHSSSPRNCPR